LAIGDETRQAIIMMRKEGTMNFYFIDVRSKLILMKNLIKHIDELLATHQSSIDNKRI